MATQFPYVKVHSVGITASGTGSISVAAPAGVSSGDLELLIVAIGITDTFDTPTGWSVVRVFTDQYDNARIGVFSRISTGDTANVSIADSGSYTIAYRVCIKNYNGSGKPMGHPIASLSRTSYGLYGFTTSSPNAYRYDSLVVYGVFSANVDRTASGWVPYTLDTTYYKGEIIDARASSTGAGADLCLIERFRAGADQVHDYNFERDMVVAATLTNPVDVSIWIMAFAVKSPDDQGLFAPPAQDVPVTFTLEIESERSYLLRADLSPLDTYVSSTVGVSKSVSGSAEAEFSFYGVADGARFPGEAANLEAVAALELVGFKEASDEVSTTSTSSFVLEPGRLVLASVDNIAATCWTMGAGEKGGRVNLLEPTLTSCIIFNTNGFHINGKIAESITVFIDVDFVRGGFGFTGSSIFSVDSSIKSILFNTDG